MEHVLTSLPNEEQNGEVDPVEGEEEKEECPVWVLNASDQGLARFIWEELVALKERLAELETEKQTREKFDQERGISRCPCGGAIVEEVRQGEAYCKSYHYVCQGCGLQHGWTM
jgi:hypothetical protein